MFFKYGHNTNIYHLKFQYLYETERDGEVTDCFTFMKYWYAWVRSKGLSDDKIVS